MARYLSFRFDDGFVASARVASACLAPDFATFFLIADLVTDGAEGSFEPLFRERDFGSVAEWRAIGKAGHDIQLHGRTHTNMTLLSKEDQRREVLDSLTLTRSLHDGPYVFCHPFNARVDLDFAALGMSGAGFDTRTSDQAIIFHRLTNPIDPFALSSWAVRERHLETVVDQLAQLPDESWTILAFHSFDGEGYEPWSSVAFDALVAAVRRLDLEIVTIAAMIARLGSI